MLIYCKLNMSEQNSVKFEYLKYIDIFSCDQTVLGMVQSVRLSVCLSVRPFVRRTFLTMFPSSHHHEILELITIVKSDINARGQRSKFKFRSHMQKIANLTRFQGSWCQLQFKSSDCYGIMQKSWLYIEGVFHFYQSHMSNFKDTRAKKCKIGFNLSVDH